GSRNAATVMCEEQLRLPVPLAVFAFVVARLFLASDVDAMALAVLATVVAGLLLASDVDAMAFAVLAAVISGFLLASDVEAMALAVLAAVISGFLLASDVEAMALAVLAFVVARLFFARHQHRESGWVLQSQVRTLGKVGHGFRVSSRGHRGSQSKSGGDSEQFFYVHSTSP